MQGQLKEVFRQGWPDPSKGSPDSARVRPLLQHAREIFAHHFGVRPDEIYFVGEPPISFHLTINGLLAENATLHYATTDRQPVHAIAHQRVNSGFPVHLHEVDSHGQISTCTVENNDVYIYQPINPETGIYRKPPDTAGTDARIVVDNTAFGINPPLPKNWSAAIWQSRSWQGPAGLGVFALQTGALWRNPLPSIDNEKVPQSFSVPLALASALALENFVTLFEQSRSEIEHLKSRIIHFLTSVIGDVHIARSSDSSRDLFSLISCAISGVDSEKLVRDLSERGFDVDTGSACISSNMAPSHVFAAMGIPTTGNLRLTLHPQTESEQVEALMVALKECVMAQRTQL